jgi:hypothetical protein
MGIPSQEFDQMLPGMIGTAEYGTAHRGVDASLGIAGKTGSCIYKGTWIGLFTSVAPVEKPKYAVVVITRGSGERGKYAAAIAGRVYQTLSPRIRPARDLAQAEARFGRRAFTRRDTAAADEDDDDDTAADDNTAANDTQRSTDPLPQVQTYRPAPTPQIQSYRPAPAQVPVQKPLVTRTVQSTPKFAPVIIQYDKSGAEKEDKQTTAPGTRPRIVKDN